MRRWLTLLLLGLVAPGCASDSGRMYANSDLELAPAYAARQVCSCVFVMQMGEDYCRRWTQVSPDIAGWRVDYEARTVQSSSLLFWHAQARFVDEHTGCVLE
jgi:hypothetical protein